eukprot:CAMPEP_0167806560 /NCGR_PEP_ID=MMETSP0111_2-20121227/21917_1 /TAXON_ID=91324 /ORGANISM="Lotharella globosa, Strain CCCM811" /LENGTH=45 /DNA_ID= /DNA_START= /DNA_END= /DNA_ORIENTATION=
MAIQLKRFQYTQQWRDKIDVFVDFPISMQSPVMGEVLGGAITGHT